jgi:hypothetical protein
MKPIRILNIVPVVALFFLINSCGNRSFSREKDKKGPLLIMAQRPNASGYPAVLIKNIPMVESHPFDGMFLNSVAGWNLMKGEPYGYGEIYDEFAVLKGAFKKFTHNFIYIFIDYPGDFWDDGAWGITAQNFANMAMVAKELGCKGIVFDNEEYLKGRWLNYGESYENPAYGFLQHRDQVMLRGKQVMEAMVAVFPAIEMFNYHGPYVSEPETSDAITKQQSGNWDRFELLGPFFIGMMQGRGNDALVIDGGEVYQYRTLEDFQLSYQWRKHDIASDETGSWMVPKDYRSQWTDNINISFGVYNRSWKTDYPMNVDIMRTTLANALKTTDKYVWYYTESDSWLIPCRMPREWTEMVREVKSAFD